MCIYKDRLTTRFTRRHVWTAPRWQGFFWRVWQVDWSGHVYGLCAAALGLRAKMLIASWVPIIPARFYAR
jgi:hypothetical protein